MDHNSMDSNPKRATSWWGSSAKTYKIVINHIFMMTNIKKNNKPHKIGNNDFITILGSTNLNVMMTATN